MSRIAGAVVAALLTVLVVQALLRQRTSSLGPDPPHPRDACGPQPDSPARRPTSSLRGHGRSPQP